MPIQILMPALSPTMESGKLAKWLVKEGDKVTSGKVLAEIETDKATMEIEAIDEGTVGKILVADGTEGVAVNAPIALLLEEGEDASALAGAGMPAGAADKGGSKGQTAGGAAGAGETAASARPGEGAGLHDALAKNASPSQGASEVKAGDAAATKTNGAAPHANGHGGRIFASPLARRLARDKGIDIAALKGSGPHGRIVAADVEAAPAGRTASGASAQTAPGQQKSQSLTVPPAGLPAAMSDEQIFALFPADSYDVVPHDNMRRTIATRLVQAKTTIPHFYLSIDCELDTLLAARARLNERAPKEGRGAYKLSVNDFIIKAMALALQRVPHANAVWTERGILRAKSSDVAVAVAIEGGLFTPVLRNAETKSLAQLSNEMKDLAERARKKRLALHEYQGGTTSISNLGMFGIKAFDAVINPPHSTILAVGEGQQRPVIRNGQVAAATVMSVTLSCDHRVVDGALGAQLLAAFKGYIEDPVGMLV